MSHTVASQSSLRRRRRRKILSVSVSRVSFPLLCLLSGPNICVSIPTMSSSQSLRDFIRERLTAAAEEIFTEFDKTIVQYEEELNRQRRLLEICWKPRIDLQRIDLSQLFNEQESHFNLDQGETKPLGQNQEDPGPEQMHQNHCDLDPLFVKKEPDEPELPQIQIEPFEMNQETDTLIENPDYDERNLRQTVPNFDQLVVQFSSDNVNQNQERSDNEDSGSSTDAKLRQINGHQKIRRNCDNIDKPKVEKQMKESLWDGEVSRTTTPTSKRPFLCATCGKGFSTSGTLSRHKKIHSGNKPHSCTTCGKQFIRKVQLLHHMPTHTDERRLSCEICGLCFGNNGNLSKHTKSHANLKSHLCPMCGKTFSVKHQLTSHIQVHTDEKAFSCEVCGKRFKSRGNLSRHKKNHLSHRPYSCATCGRGFLRNYQLTTHIETHK
ncbi:PREDICTED: zinc finger and SCAN domain-containing protein 21-like isoform X2 [Poecilia mexicana]|uniref:zinc finger and SCAN domain-containing protein 21-like isoform X2 n=1 Tax=Poecilia mexicana TaxID=48701 RepID=UPI00072DE766|nr:PREDICTED: zinc finger and SCAN domain-containing protein 21-like isoform X2 [Poecilia mexicana]